MIGYVLSSYLGIGEIILIAACAAIVIGAIITAIIRKVQGKKSCGGDCGCYNTCPHCNADALSDTKND